MKIPELLKARCSTTPEGAAWLEGLPDLVADLTDAWEITMDAPFDGPEGGAAWVAPATLHDGTPVVLKLGMPHFEGDHEIAALRLLDGDPTVRLIRADEQRDAMLLERCMPGTPLRDRPQLEQDVIVAGLLKRIWRTPIHGETFRPLSTMIDLWVGETLADREHWSDPGLVEEGISLFRELSADVSEPVLLATDLHAGNVLTAEREPWLVIDVKPFVGDPAYDATQHLINCEELMLTDPIGTIARFAELLEVDAERVRLWLFARYAAETHGDRWKARAAQIARSLSART